MGNLINFAGTKLKLQPRPNQRGIVNVTNSLFKLEQRKLADEYETKANNIVTGLDSGKLTTTSAEGLIAGLNRGFSRKEETLEGQQEAYLRQIQNAKRAGQSPEDLMQPWAKAQYEPDSSPKVDAVAADRNQARANKRVDIQQNIAQTYLDKGRVENLYQSAPENLNYQGKLDFYTKQETAFQTKMDEMDRDIRLERVASKKEYLQNQRDFTYALYKSQQHEEILQNELQANYGEENTHTAHAREQLQGYQTQYLQNAEKMAKYDVKSNTENMTFTSDLEPEHRQAVAALNVLDEDRQQEQKAQAAQQKQAEQQKREQRNITPNRAELQAATVAALVATEAGQSDEQPPLTAEEVNKAVEFADDYQSYIDGLEKAGVKVHDSMKQDALDAKQKANELIERAKQENIDLNDGKETQQAEGEAGATDASAADTTSEQENVKEAAKEDKVIDEPKKDEELQLAGYVPETLDPANDNYVVNEAVAVEQPDQEREQLENNQAQPVVEQVTAEQVNEVQPEAVEEKQAEPKEQLAENSMQQAAPETIEQVAEQQDSMADQQDNDDDATKQAEGANPTNMGAPASQETFSKVEEQQLGQAEGNGNQPQHAHNQGETLELDAKHNANSHEQAVGMDQEMLQRQQDVPETYMPEEMPSNSTVEPVNTMEQQVEVQEQEFTPPPTKSYSTMSDEEIATQAPAQEQVQELAPASEPVVIDEPVVAQEPVVVEESVVAEEPVVEQPVAVQEPVVAEPEPVPPPSKSYSDMPDTAIEASQVPPPPQPQNTNTSGY